jgi:predicted membrane protein
MRIALSLMPPWWEQGLALLVAAGLAVWLLLQPSLIQGLVPGLRFPAVLLGVWALGAAFLRPLALEPPHRWQRRALSPPWSHLALLLFALLVVARALLV